MWCVSEITPEFIERMENLLTLYSQPYNALAPVLCFDEKSKQLLEETRLSQNTEAGKPRRKDYEYKRNGTRNIFVCVEPKGGHREVTVTRHRKRSDFAKEIRRIVELPRYARAEKIHCVVDNLNTHFEKSFYGTFEKEEAERILSKMRFHYTPKHASWLNMAEIEIGILDRQSIRGRIPTQEMLTSQICFWKKERNKSKAMISWTFTVKDARKKFKYASTKLI